MKKYFLLCILFAAAVVNMQAQEYKTTESVRSQLKGNRVPGWQYATDVAAKSTDGKGAPGTAVTVNNTQKTQPTTAEHPELSSSKPAEKTEAVKKTVPAAITGQGNVTFEQAEEQAKKLAPVPIKPAVTPTQGEMPKEERKQQQ
jgi:hypothetical protein